MAKSNRMRYNRELQMWQGRAPDGRTVYISETLYEQAYNKHLSEKRFGHRPNLYAMTHSDYWLPIAKDYQAELGQVNTEAFIE